METKLCKHCKSEIPKEAKVCPNCRKKQGGIGKWIIIAILVIILIAAVSGGGDDKTDEKQAGNSNVTADSSAAKGDEVKETAKADDMEEMEMPVEYISVSATELSDILSNNAMKAQNDYKDQYLEITGKLGNIDSSGKYIGIVSDNDFDLTNIQCYIKSDEQKEAILEMSRGDAIVVRGYCTDVGEIIGYSIDIDGIEKQ